MGVLVGALGALMLGGLVVGTWALLQYRSADGTHPGGKYSDPRQVEREINIAASQTTGQTAQSQCVERVTREFVCSVLVKNSITGSSTSLAMIVNVSEDGSTYVARRT